jgi:hypothetical protein
MLWLQMNAIFVGCGNLSATFWRNTAFCTDFFKGFHWIQIGLRAF